MFKPYSNNTIFLWNMVALLSFSVGFKLRMFLCCIIRIRLLQTTLFNGFIIGWSGLFCDFILISAADDEWALTFGTVDCVFKQLSYIHKKFFAIFIFCGITNNIRNEGSLLKQCNGSRFKYWTTQCRTDLNIHSLLNFSVRLILA